MGCGEDAEVIAYKIEACGVTTELARTVMKLMNKVGGRGGGHRAKIGLGKSIVGVFILMWRRKLGKGMKTRN